MEKILQRLRDNEPTLTSLYFDNFYGKRLDPEDVEYALEKNMHPFYYGIRLEDEDVEAAAVAAALERNTTLTSLTIENTRLTDVGGVAVAGALERNTTLTELNLAHNHLASLSAEALARMLERNTTLTSLDLSGNFFGEVAGVAFARALERNTTLTALNLAFNGLGEDTGVAFARAMERNTTLTFLRLTAYMKDETLQKIEQLLEANRDRRKHAWKFKLLKNRIKRQEQQNQQPDIGRLSKLPADILYKITAQKCLQLLLI